jgi:hypothetical protein
MPNYINGRVYDVTLAWSDNEPKVHVMRFRKLKGHSFVEVLCALALFIPIFLALIDLYVLVFGYWWCISNCRLAARTAAQGPPAVIMREAPTQRAVAFLMASTAGTGNTIHLVSSEVTESIKSLPDPVYGGAVNGTVTVDIVVDVIPPFLVKSFLPAHKYTIDVSETCPYTWVSVGTGIEKKEEETKWTGTH